MGRGIWWGMRAIGGKLKSGGRAVGKASWGAGGKMASIITGKNRNEDSESSFSEMQGQVR
jgi:hypothetical protein